MPGIVYLLTNQAMPSLVKIGHIKDCAEKNARDRMRELSYPSGVPLPFECHYACEVEDATEVEQSFLALLLMNESTRKENSWQSNRKS